MIDPRLVLLGMLVVAFIFWAMLSKLINKVLDVIERKHADHR